MELKVTASIGIAFTGQSIEAPEELLRDADLAMYQSKRDRARGYEVRDLRELHLAGGVAGGVLHVAAFAASCDNAGDVEFPACHVHQQDWGIPVRVTAGGARRLPLLLRGMDG